MRLPSLAQESLCSEFTRKTPVCLFARHALSLPYVPGLARGKPAVLRTPCRDWRLCGRLARATDGSGKTKPGPFGD